MRPGRVARALLRRIDGYRGSYVQVRWGGHCRFTPTCSHYAEEALRHRALPIALLLVVWRVVRCNPLAGRVLADPLARRGRQRLHRRANAVPTACAIVALTGFVVVVTAGVAHAVGVSSGCTASVNGIDPKFMPANDPLEVSKGESVAVRGTAPRGTPADDRNVTAIKIEFVEDIFKVTTKNHPGNGPNWGGTKNVDDYLKYGVGLYHVEGFATGSSGWNCSGDGYVKLEDGNPLGKPVGGGAAAVSLIGAFGAALSSRPGKEPEAPETPKTPEDEAAEEATDEVLAASDVLERDAGSEAAAGVGCLLLLLFATAIAMGVEDPELYPMAAVAARPPARGRIWVHGHPIMGFISGLFCGLGITVLLQQFAVWPLTITTAIAFPIVVGLIAGVRAYLGRPYKRG